MRIRNILALIAFMFLFAGCGKVTPPGKTVIILKPNGESEIITKGLYRPWGRDKLYFVDGRLQSFKEPMKILCADDINMDVDVKTILAFEVDKKSIEFIKQKVPATKVDTDGDIEGYQLSLSKFYDMVVKDVVRGSARNLVSTYITDNIRPNRQQIEADIAALIKKRVAELNYPIVISAVLVSNIDYPEEVTAMRKRIKEAQLADQEKAALAEATLAETKRQVAIEMEKAKVRMVKAQAQADENEILTTSLTPQFLQWRQFEVMEAVSLNLSGGGNNTVFMMPYDLVNQDMLNNAMIRDAVQDIGEEE